MRRRLAALDVEDTVKVSHSTILNVWETSSFTTVREERSSASYIFYRESSATALGVSPRNKVVHAGRQPEAAAWCTISDGSRIPMSVSQKAMRSSQLCLKGDVNITFHYYCIWTCTEVYCWIRSSSWDLQCFSGEGKNLVFSSKQSPTFYVVVRLKSIRSFLFIIKCSYGNLPMIQFCYSCHDWNSAFGCWSNLIHIDAWLHASRHEFVNGFFF